VKRSLFSNIIKIADEERLSIKSYAMRDMILNPYLQKRGDYSDGFPLHSQSDSGKGTEQLLQEIEEREKYIKQMTAKTDSLEKEAYEEGFAQGEKAGMELGEKRFDSVVKSFNEVLESVRRLKEEVYQNSEQEMLELILAIARRVIQKEISTDRKITLSIIQSALKYVTDQEEIRVRLNPSDLEFASQYKREMMDGMKKVVFENDEDVSRGHTVIESNHGIIDCGIEKHLQEVEEALRAQAGRGNILEGEGQKESRENNDS
jgi:flagellar assembly protein FliH